MESSNLKNFWIVGHGRRIRALDGLENPPLVFASEMFAFLSGFVSMKRLCELGRAREARLLRERCSAFLRGDGPHPATMGLDG